ncbi:type I-E CRISPR-associated protein Cas7/Cse4/CasC [Bowdeniella nasicola]|uniref:Type I-E CRISPR-associated protein Cas7/Cse4/CasC n=1 Tax=Bowdeniella nasicola TaxID=208480 RepID=A0A1Q5PZN6_9ACTO|nr:type I-E CRISPR-associated protein Cas7/Cse4/CasC [Bowdeniella nasicola]OKL52915.1 type I-E CRISPR-associated protein Cas7/Cse4/CasC [Bowdeniella nasicola]
MATYLDFHVLLTLPPNNINRGEDGAPKTAFFGGVQRQRVSSQALKAAQRKAFQEHLDTQDLGVRTKRIVELVADEILRQDSDVSEETAQKWAEDAFNKAGIKVARPKPKKGEDPSPAVSGALVFLGRHQIERLAAVLLEKQGEALTKKEAQAAIDQEHSIDLALFGRMIADDAALNVDAACQYAHAIGVHEAMPDFDYYTAIDDEQQREEIAGAGMIGTIEMMSSTMYRYATINIDQLKKNLGDDEAVKRAVEAFTTTFIESLPTGKQNTFAALTLPDLVSVMVRDRRPVSLVNAFENPVTGVSRRQTAVKRLAEEAQAVEQAFGSRPTSAWVVTTPTFADAAVPLGKAVTTAELVALAGDAAFEAAQEVEAV